MWGNDSGCKTFENAIVNENLEMLQWLHENGCTKNVPDVSRLMIKIKKLEILEFGLKTFVWRKDLT